MVLVFTEFDNTSVHCMSGLGTLSAIWFRKRRGLAGYQCVGEGRLWLWFCCIVLFL